jgi:pimeloyl-ACP methyl ester carboxylesterase
MALRHSRLFDVTPSLAAAGYRVIVPYLRGYGTTRFLSSATPRNGQPSVLALDIINLMDALKIPTATLAGFDWRARTADIIAALWPERCKGLVSVSGYLIGSQAAGKVPSPPPAELQCCTSTTSLRIVAGRVTTNTDTTFRSSSGGLPLQNGTSMRPRSIVAPPLSITRTM